jgi:UDP-GlcNAc:undecaprenyl-phosphate GlcNAc-1-phosphate transferase
MLPLVGPLSMGAFALPVTVFWIVGVTNAINLIDGLDGLAGGVVVFAAITNLVVAHVTGAVFVAVTMLAVLGSVVGFLVFNFNPARVFMGDSGSYFLGFLLGTMSLAGAAQKASTTVSLLVPVLALGLPIVDTSFAMVRRFLERRSLFSADRGHIHHRLLDMGLTHRRAVLTLYGICLLFTVIAIGVSLGRMWTVGLAMLAATLLGVGATRFVGHYQHALVLRRQKTRLRSREVELLRRVLPEVPAMFEAARSEGDVWAALRTVAERGQIASFDVLKPDGSDVQLTGSAPSKDIARDRDAISARFPVGPDAFARAELRFRWQSDTAEVSPQVEVLIQIIVDVVARALTRVNSPLAPLPPETLAVDKRNPAPAADVRASS